MLYKVIQTDPGYIWLLLRVTAGVIIFPYGMQKLFGWFNGPGIVGTLEEMSIKKIPLFISWLIIIGQSFGSVALITGLFSRIAAGGCMIIFTGALIVHAPDGWMLNWFGKKRGEGIEYFVLLLVMLLVVLIKGSGAVSIDLWLIDKL